MDGRVGCTDQCCGFNGGEIQNCFPDDRHHRISVKLATAGNAGVCLAIHRSGTHLMVDVHLSESGLAISETALIEMKREAP